MSTITVQDAVNLIRKRPAIVLGPAAGTEREIETELLVSLRQKYKTSGLSYSGDDWMGFVDVLLSKDPSLEGECRALIEKAFNEAPVAPHLHPLIKGQFSAVISIALDANFWRMLRERRKEQAVSRPVITVATRETVVPPKSTPFYALTGLVDLVEPDERLVISLSDYRSRRRNWRGILSGLVHRIQGDPLIFLGTHSCPARVVDLLDELMALSPGHPQELLFVSGDPILADPTVANLVRHYANIREISCAVPDLCRALSDELIRATSLPLFAGVENPYLERTVIRSLAGHVTYVPTTHEVPVDENAFRKNCDMLFRPSFLDWAPYRLEMPFKRTVVREILQSVTTAVSHKKTELYIGGAAAVGKTTAMRSAAFELANKPGLLCFWFHRSYQEFTRERMAHLIRRLNAKISENPTVVFWIDDPLNLGLDVRMFRRELREATFSHFLVVCAKGSDYLDEPTTTPAWDITVPEHFDNEELARLPDYLCSLRIAATESAAHEMLRGVANNAKDILCHFYYLLPATREAIEASIRDEYIRLGGFRKTVKLLAEAAESEAGTRDGAIRMAYELVAICSSLDELALPIELLISCLQRRFEMSYHDWFSVGREGSPLWGLIYADESDDGDTTVYRMRNQVVADVVRGQINKASFECRPEFSKLRDLVAACDGGGSHYQQFLRELLIRRSSHIASRYTLDQANELYELGLSVARSHQNIIEHHFLKVQRRLGGDCREIYDRLKSLLERIHATPADSDNESLGNVENSAAATLRESVSRNELDPIEGAEKAFTHICSALSHDQLSVHAHHVHAGMLFDLAERVRDIDPDKAFIHFERAMQLVDRGRAILPFRTRDRSELSASHRMFDTLEERGVNALPQNKLTGDVALEVLESSGSQSLLVLVARMLLQQAVKSGKGAQFKKVDELLRDGIKILELREIEPGIPFRLLRSELKIAWQLLPAKGPVYWEELEDDLRHVLRCVEYTNDLGLNFYLAVTLFHLGQAKTAEAIFHRNRISRIPHTFLHAPRCFFLGDKSGPQILEGTIRRSASKRFIKCSELGEDFEVRNADFRDDQDEQKLFKLVFCLSGPLACARDFTI